MTDRKPIRIALLGCGWHARDFHAAPLAYYAAEHPGDVELVAACDLDEQKARDAAEKFGFAATYTDMDKMFVEARPDGVICVMAIKHVAEMGIRLLRRGAVCTIEKPLGTSAEQAHALADAAGETQTSHMVSVNRRYWPHIVQAAKWISERSPLRFIRATMLRRERAEPQFIWGTAIHPMDTMVYLAGSIASYDARLIGGEELTTKWYSLSLDFAGGCCGELQILPTCGRCAETYELFGEACCARVSMSATTMDGEEMYSLRCWEGGKCVVDECIADPERPWLGFGCYGEVCAFIESLRDGAPLRPTVADVLPATDICFELAERFAC